MSFRINHLSRHGCGVAKEGNAQFIWSRQTTTDARAACALFRKAGETSGDHEK
jgi:uncharacterized protein YigE (DUF2233 family)